MKARARQLEQTRRAILDALAAEISESGVIDLSVQRVADRAGVTHRTVYNHFPTREALNDAFAEHVEQVLAESAALGPDRPETNVQLSGLPDLAERTHQLFGDHGAELTAYVILSVASGAPAGVFRKRSQQFEQLLECDLGPLEPGLAKQATSALRLFLSSAGWHLMTRHHGLTAEQSGRVSKWAVQQLVAALQRGEFPEGEEQDDA